MFPTVDLLVCHNDGVFHVKVVRYVGFFRLKVQYNNLESGQNKSSGGNKNKTWKICQK